jgi:hypothetical protein
VKEMVVRFVIGGIVVSSFAVLGDLFKPKSLAGLFGAAPSVALAALGLTVASAGKWYAATGGWAKPHTFMPLARVKRPWENFLMFCAPWENAQPREV